MRRPNLTLALLFAAFALVSLGHAARAEPATSADIAALKKEMADVKRELGEIKTLLTQATQRRVPPPQIAKIVVEDGQAIGDPKAPLTMVEFTDYDCPFCRRFALQVMPSIKKNYIQTGKLRYVLRDFPLSQIHPKAKNAAVAAHCAGEQNKYWEMHEVLFQKNREHNPDQLKGHAKALGLDDAKFSECLGSKRYDKKIATDLTDGQKAGVRGTPTFFVGPTADGKTIIGRAVTGARPYEAFKQAFETALAEIEKSKKSAKGKDEKTKQVN